MKTQDCALSTSTVVLCHTRVCHVRVEKSEYKGISCKKNESHDSQFLKDSWRYWNVFLSNILRWNWKYRAKHLVLNFSSYKMTASKVNVIAEHELWLTIWVSKCRMLINRRAASLTTPNASGSKLSKVSFPIESLSLNSSVLDLNSVSLRLLRLSSIALMSLTLSMSLQKTETLQKVRYEANACSIFLSLHGERDCIWSEFGSCGDITWSLPLFMIQLQQRTVL